MGKRIDMPARRDAAARALYLHAELDCYECLDCGEMIEVPRRGVMKAGRNPEPIRNHPENRLLWLELQTLDHAECHQYQDEQKARQAREFRRRVKRAMRPRTGLPGFRYGGANA